MATWREKIKELGEYVGDFMFYEGEEMNFTYFVEDEELEEKLLDLPYSLACKNYVTKLVKHFDKLAEERFSIEFGASDAGNKKASSIITDLVINCSGRDKDFCKCYYRSIINQEKKSKSQMKKGGRPVKVKLEEKQIKFIQKGK